MTIYVKAFLEKNFGDDLMLIELLKQFPTYHFEVYCRTENRDFYDTLLEDFTNFSFTPIELYQIPEKYPENSISYIILLGGSVLMGSREEGIFFRERNINSIQQCKEQGIKYLIIGCNTGPFISATTENAVKNEIKEASLMITRDKTSYIYAKDIIPNNVNWTKDILWNIAPIHSENHKKFGLGITLFYTKNKEESLEFWTSIVDSYIESTGEQICLFAFSVGIQEDHILCNDVKRKSKYPSSIEIIEHSPSNPYGIVDHIALCEKMVAIRFHGLVMALACSIPVLPLSYSTKTDLLLDDLDASSYKLPLSYVEKLPVSDFIQDFLLSDPCYYKKDKDLYQNMRTQMELLQEFLEKDKNYE